MELTSRRESAYNRRLEIARLARDRPHEKSYNNGEEGRYRDPRTGRPSYTARFTKGLPHHSNGQLANPDDYVEFLRAIDSGLEADIRRCSRGPLRQTRDAAPQWRSRLARAAKAKVRSWESMAGGLAFSLQGPDAHALALPPAPTLDSPEITQEMGELYLMALLRDLPFAAWGAPSTPHPEIANAIQQLNELPLLSQNSHALRESHRSLISFSNIFRGFTPGVQNGPYISQFLLIGTKVLGDKGLRSTLDGQVRFGATSISQKVQIASPGKDYMTDFCSFLDVQDGADLRGLETYEEGERFITTPRDLATYVHYDALHQAYLTTCNILLTNKVPFDPGLSFQEPDSDDGQTAFAHFGGPHILTLVCEVATRALKSILYQKFNIHRRLRPEAVGGLIDERIRASEEKKDAFPEVAQLTNDLQPILSKIEQHNHAQNKEARTCGCSRSKPSTSRHLHPSTCKSRLLPIAYQEGSPMHPSYGAGHAVVAGACVTVLKSFFDSNHELDKIYEASEDGSTLKELPSQRKLTVGHELNKLAENISIGRNWAGVHYFRFVQSLRVTPDR